MRWLQKLFTYVKARPRMTALCLFGFMVGVFVFSPWHVLLIKHQSVKYKLALYAPVEASYSPRQGDYILVEWQGEDPNDIGLTKGLLLVKRVGCPPGGKLEIENGEAFFCDGVPIGMAATHTPPSGKPIKPVSFHSTSMDIPRHLVFLIGDNPQSYDSKYLGLFNISSIRGLVHFGF